MFSIAMSWLVCASGGVVSTWSVRPAMSDSRMSVMPATAMSRAEASVAMSP